MRSFHKSRPNLTGNWHMRAWTPVQTRLLQAAHEIKLKLSISYFAHRMAVAVWVYLAVLAVLAVHFRQRIIDRCRLIYFLYKIPGPFSVPILGTTWMMKWRISEMTVQVLEWVIYYMQQKADLICFWIGPIPMVAAFSAESVKVVIVFLKFRI